jgi:hypothetical protein
MLENKLNVLYVIENVGSYFIKYFILTNLQRVILPRGFQRSPQYPENNGYISSDTRNKQQIFGYSLAYVYIYG